MTSLATFLRAAAMQFTSLVNATISALQVKRRSQVIAVALLSLFIAFVMTRAVQTARSQQHLWLSNRTVLVAISAIAAGDEFTDANTDLIDLPIAILPSNALTRLSLGDTARIALEPHTAITAAMTIPANESVQIPVGWRIVALPADMPTPPLSLNEAVDVVAGESVVAASVIVASLDPLTIAVPADVAASVASVVHMGEASLIATR